MILSWYKCFVDL